MKSSFMIDGGVTQLTGNVSILPPGMTGRLLGARLHNNTYDDRLEKGYYLLSDN